MIDTLTIGVFPWDRKWLSLGRWMLSLLLCSLLIGCGPESNKVETENPKAATSSQTTAKTTAVSSPVKAETKPAPVNGTKFQFRDATAEWGLKFTRFDDMQGQNRNQEANGGGVAIVDADQDGRLDLFFTQGNRLPRTKHTDEFSNEYFRNCEPGQLPRMTEQARLVAHAFHTGCTVGDYDADGFPDLYITAYGRSSLWRNQGDGTFEDVSRSSKSMIDSWTTSAAFADLNGDSFLDLYVATYFDAPDDPPRICKEPRSPVGTMQCSPTLFNPLPDVLLVNDGQGGFVDVTQAAGITSPDGRGLGVVATDINGDDRIDLYVANDMSPCFLYVNQTSPDDKLIEGTDIRLPQFKDQGVEFGVAMNGDGKATAAMGIAHGDYDNDGWIDFLITNYYLETNTLHHNMGGKSFADWSTPSRLGPPSRPTLAFGTEFLDVDADGWLDLVVTTGHIEDRDWTKTEGYRMRPHLFRNDRNGRFTDVAASAGSYFEKSWVGRGLAVGDLDRDGDLDLVMAQQLDPSVILLNETPQAHRSVTIRLVGTNQTPRCGIGVTARTSLGTVPIFRDLAGGGSFQSASALEIHMSLSDSDPKSEMDVHWPGGVSEVKLGLPGRYILRENEGTLLTVP